MSTKEYTSEQLRNVAIIAHVDHGKTTLVDELFKQAGLFRDNQDVQERLMDSMDLERERGITIASKNGGFTYKDHWINIIDTPGHADFGGQVERVLSMADGALLLVDAQEGPMPQTYFVLKKALALQLPIMVVINKIDKPAARIDWVLDQVLELFINLDADEELLEFPVVYASAKQGIAKKELSDESENLLPLMDEIIKQFPAPKGDINGPLQLRICSLSYSNFLGQLAIGKITSGSAQTNQEVVVSKSDGTLPKSRLTKIYRYERNEQVVIDKAIMGDIVAVGGISTIGIGETITDPENPIPLPMLDMDPPTISMTFIANDSPFSGKEGQFVTSTQLEDRLQKEMLLDIALKVSPGPSGGFLVSGRGELHLSILIEKMRREGYEFQVSRPEVIFKTIDDKKHEPFEEVTVEAPTESQGKLIESLSSRKGEMKDMQLQGDQVQLIFHMPSRGLLGYRNEFMTETKGLGTLNNRFLEYRPALGSIPHRKLGVLIAKETCTTVAFALFNLQDRGQLFLGAGCDVYGGQIIGLNSRDDDMVVNPAKGKKLTNMRASGSDDSVVLTPPRKLSLEDCLSFIEADELVEVTPQSIRIRKKILDESRRKQKK